MPINAAKQLLKNSEQTIMLLKLTVWYLSLVVGLVGGMLLFWWLWPNQWALRFVAFILAFFYISWGVIGHLKTNTFSKRVLWEYISVAFLGALVLWLVIQ